MPVKIFDGIYLVSREEWGARTDLPRLGYFVPREVRTKTIFHHTVTVLANDDEPNIWEPMELLAAKRMMQRLQIGRPDLGDDVPYSWCFFLGVVGTEHILWVCEGRGIDRTGSHTQHQNTAGYGFGLVGDFRIDTPNIAAYGPMFAQFMSFLRFVGCINLRAIQYHGLFAATLCPGPEVVNELLPAVR